MLDYIVSDFKVYVSEVMWFKSRLPRLEDMIVSSYRIGERWDDSKVYYRILFAIYCATYCCVVSLTHLTGSSDASSVITSLMRFHIYFTTRRILRRLDGGKSMGVISREFGAGQLYDEKDMRIRRHKVYIPITRVDPYSHKNAVHNEWTLTLMSSFKNDYRYYVPRDSSGFTAVGEKYLNESIEAQARSILGAQAQTRISIISNGAASIQTQDVFRKLVEDTIIQTSVTVSISNMRKAISDCNVTVNTAVSQNLWSFVGGQTHSVKYSYL